MRPICVSQYLTHQHFKMTQGKKILCDQNTKLVSDPLVDKKLILKVLLVSFYFDMKTIKKIKGSENLIK